MAIFSQETQSTVWSDQGFIKTTVPPGLEGKARSLARDGRLVFDGAIITDVLPSLNPVQPTPRPRTRLDDLKDKLAATRDDPAAMTVIELMELQRLERGL